MGQPTEGDGTEERGWAGILGIKLINNQQMTTGMKKSCHNAGISHFSTLNMDIPLILTHGYSPTD